MASSRGIKIDEKPPTTEAKLAALLDANKNLVATIVITILFHWCLLKNDNSI